MYKKEAVKYTKPTHLTTSNNNSIFLTLLTSL